MAKVVSKRVGIIEGLPNIISILVKNCMISAKKSRLVMKLIA